jgi:uncharacterized protein
MTLAPQTLEIPPSAQPKAALHETAAPPAELTGELVFARLKASGGIWKAFTTEAGHFLLHVPSAHVLSVPESYVKQVRGESADAAVQAEIDALAATIVVPKTRPIEVDIRSVSLNLAQGCNLRCTYCFAGEGDYGNKGMMSVETAVAAIQSFAKGKPSFRVIFFGGEPMLAYGTIQKVVAWCEEDQKTSGTRYSFGMTTNGTLLTEERLLWLKSKKFGLTWSYDGHGLHAKQRLNKDLKTDSEALVERKLAALKGQLDEWSDFKLRATVTKANLERLEAAMTATLDSKDLRFMVSHHSAKLANLGFTLKDIERFGAIMRQVVERYLAARDYERLLKLDNIRRFVGLIHRGKVNVPACAAGTSYVTVSTAGAYYLCHRFNEDESERIGDVGSGLDKAKAQTIADFRNRRKDPCGTCWMREWCAGGCMYEHKADSGDALAPSPLFCLLQETEAELAMRVYTVISAEAPHLLDV